ncbi:MAG: hypothetical protein PHF66_04320, partial [Desulfobacteraceae bacterium]|nr:hypothetical protein [Desulfobacteraceae bacterium]
GFVLAQGSFEIVKRTVDVDVNGDGFSTAAGSPDLTDASMMLVSLTGVDLFVGVGGAFSADKSSIETGGAIGFSVGNANLVIGIITPARNVGASTGIDARKWFGLKSFIGSAALVGIDGLTIKATDLSIEVNRASGNVPVAALNWTTALDLDSDGIFGEPEDIYDVGPDLNPQMSAGELALDSTEELLKATGTVTLDAFGFFFVSGSFSFEKSTETISVATGTAIESVEVNMLSLGAAGVDAFAGVNGPYYVDSNGDGIIDGADTPNEAAMGLVLEDVEFALALMKPKPPAAPTNSTDLRSWISLRAGVGEASFVGVEGLIVSVSNFWVNINKGGGTTGTGLPNQSVAHFAVNPMMLETGGDPIVLNFDGTKGALLEAAGHVRLDVFGFFYVDGAFAFKKSSETITVTNGTSSQTVQVDLLTVGASGVDAFAGVNGPYMVDSNGDGVIDGNDTPNTNALGLSLSDVNFALALMKPKVSATATTKDLRSWTSLRAGIGEASFVGVEGLTISVSDFWVNINKGGGKTATGAANDTVAHFKSVPLVVATGDGNDLALNFDGMKGTLLQASGALTLGIEDFAIAGGFAIERSVHNEVRSGRTIQVSKLLIGAAGVEIFLGAGEEPYDNEDTGVLVEDVKFGLALYKEMDVTNPNAATPVGTGSKMALAASGGARLLGIDGLVLSGTLGLRKNNTGYTKDLGGGYVVNEALNIPDPDNPGTLIPVEIQFKENVDIGLSGTVVFAIVDPETGDEFVSLEGGFAFEKETSADGKITRIKVGAAGVETFLGVGPAKILDETTADPDDTIINPDAMGVFIQDVTVGVVLIKKAATTATPATSSYALDAGGAASLLGIENLSISGSLRVRVNKTGAPVDEHVIVPLAGGGTKDVHIQFKTVSADPTLTGTLDLDVAGVVTLSGGFSFTKHSEGAAPNITTKILVGIANAEAFVGVDAGTPDALGVRATIDKLGLVLYKSPAGSSYAMEGSGGVSLVGLDGLGIDGNAAVQINQSGKVVNETFHVPNPDFDENLPVSVSNPETIQVAVSFATPAEVMAFRGDLTFSVADVFTLTGTVSFRKAATGKVQIDIPNASLLVVMNGTEVVGVTGHAKFSIGNPDGFKLQDLSVDGFSIFGVSAGIDPATPVASLPSADLVFPLDGGAVNQSDLFAKKYIDVTFNDPEGVGLNLGTITDSLPEIALTGPNGESIPVNGTPRKIGYNTYRYTLSITAITQLTLGDWQVEVKASSFADNDGNRNIAEIESFAIRDGPKPTANLSNPVSNAQVDLMLLNARGFIDVTFSTFDGATLDTASILDANPEFVLVGTGVKDAGLTGAVSGTPELLYGTTYRYRIIDLQPNNNTALVGAGTVQVQFIAGSWKDSVNNINNAETESFNIVAATAGTRSATGGLAIGPLSLQGPTLGVTAIGFKDMKLILTIGIGAEVASLNFGSSTTQQSTQQQNSGISTTLTGLLGTFDLAVDVLGFLQGSGSIDLTGKWGLNVSSFVLTVPDVVVATAQGVKIGYDPAYERDDPDTPEIEDVPQTIVTIARASISFPKIKLSGWIDTYDPDGTGPQAPIPGLTVFDDGFRFGTAVVAYGLTQAPGTGVPVSQGTNTAPGAAPGAAIKIGSILEFNDIRVGVNNFEVHFGQAVDFDGEIFIASGGAKFFKDMPVNATISDRTSGMNPGRDGIPGTGDDISEASDTEALRATLEFEDGRVKAFRFLADTFRIELGSFLAIKGVDIYLNTDAGDDEPVVSFISLGAELKVASLKLTGEARYFAFLGNGDFKANAGFGVFFGVESVTGGSVGWPSWLPIKIKEIGIQWRNINTDPLDFILTLSATVESIDGLPGAQFSGTVEGVKIDLGLLFEGKFPIIDIASIGVNITADAFGGKITGALIGGILKIDNNNQMISALAPPDTPVKDRIFFMGIQGGFTMLGAGGFTIRLALSELGPLGVQIEASLPDPGIILEPNTGLAINDFVGGIEFFKSLPDVSKPKELRDPRFAISASNIDAGMWLDQVKLQVVNQYIAVQANPNLGGFLAAFTSPMLITGSAKVYTAYASKYVFNGMVGLKISTDGKILIVGKLNFANDMLSVSAKMYANLSKIADGQAKILFLFDAPDQIELLTVGGKMEMLFSMGDEDVEYDFADPLEKPVAVLASPGDGDSVFREDLNANGYFDLGFLPSDDAGFVDGTILDATDMVLTGEAAAGVALTSVEEIEDGKFRYHFDGDFAVGDVSIEIGAGSFTDDAGNSNDEETLSFSVKDLVASLSGPQDGGSIDVSALNANKYISVRYSPSPGWEIDESSLNDNDTVFTLSFVDGRTLAVSGPGTLVDGAYRYLLPEDFEFVPGEVTVTFAAGTWADTGGRTNAQSSESFLVTGPTATLVDPLVGSRIDVAAINGLGYVEIQLAPSEGSSLVESSIAGFSGVFMTLTQSDGSTLEIRGPPTKISETLFRFDLPEGFVFVPGEVSVTFAAGTFTDAAGFTNISQTQTFTVTGPIADLVETNDDGTLTPLDGSIYGLSRINGHQYIDIRFAGTTGNALDPASITDASPEFSLAGSAVNDVSILDGEVQDLGNGVFRYTFTGSFVPGELTVQFIAGAWQDLDADGDPGYLNLAETESITLKVPSATITDPGEGGSADRATMDDRGYILITFKNLTGLGLDEASILDADPEFRFNSVDNPDTVEIESAAAGIVLTGVVEKVEGSTDTYKYYYSGSFAEGLVEVSFIAGSYADLGGNTNQAETYRFRIIDQAISIRFIIEGFAELNAGGFTPDYDGDGVPDPLISLEGRVELSIDIIRDPVTEEIQKARFLLDVSATLKLFYLGNVGSAAGRFVLSIGETPYDDASASSIFGTNKLQFWGVLKLETGLDKLREIGIEADAEVLLQINATSEEKTEVIFLEGIKGDTLFTVDDNGISAELPQDISAGSFLTTLPESVRNAFSANGIEFSDAATFSVQGVESGKRWKIYVNEGDLQRQYFIDKKDNQLIFYGEAQTFVLAPYTFALSMAGALKFKIPPIADDSEELFRMSGVFHMQISTSRAEMFAKADLTLGPESSPILEFDALGLIVINFEDPGFAGRINLLLKTGGPLEGILDFEAAFDLYINATISGNAQEFRVPDMFLDPEKGYLDQKFIDSLEFGTGDLLFSVTDSGGSIKDALNETTDEDGNVISGTVAAAVRAAFDANGQPLGESVAVRTVFRNRRWESDDGTHKYVVETSAGNAAQLNVYEAKTTGTGDGAYVMVPRGPPQLDGTLGSAGPYVVIQGAGKLSIANMFVMKGAFRFELSTDKLELQISATMRLGNEADPLFFFQVMGYLEIDWDAGVVGLLSLEASTGGILKDIGFDAEADFKLQINSTDQDRQALILLAPGETTTITIPRNTYRIMADG